MAYEPKTWVCGEKIKAEDLNHIEQGIADASESRVTPSVIRLGSFNGGGGVMGSSNFYSFAGGGLLSESKTLAELVGDKTVIGIEFQLPDPSLPSFENGVWGVAISGNGEFSRSPIPIIPKEAYGDIISLSVYCVSNQSISQVDAFAICV